MSFDFLWNMFLHGSAPFGCVLRQLRSLQGEQPAISGSTNNCGIEQNLYCMSGYNSVVRCVTNNDAANEAKFKECCTKASLFYEEY